MKIRPVIAESIHADGRTDMTKLTVAFRNFGNALKNTLFVHSDTCILCLLLAVVRITVRSPAHALNVCVFPSICLVENSVSTAQ